MGQWKCYDCGKLSQSNVKGKRIGTECTLVPYLNYHRSRGAGYEIKVDENGKLCHKCHFRVRWFSKLPTIQEIRTQLSTKVDVPDTTPKAQSQRKYNKEGQGQSSSDNSPFPTPTLSVPHPSSSALSPISPSTSATATATDTYTPKPTPSSTSAAMLTPSNKNHPHGHDPKSPGPGLALRRNSASSAAQQKSITDFFHTTKSSSTKTPRRSKRIPEQIIKSEREQKLSVAIVEGTQDGLKKKDFPGKGRGIVSTRKFSRGDFVVEYCGELLDSYAAREREKQYGRDRTIGCYMFYFTHKDHQYCVDATAESDRLGRLVNHCRNGNLVPKVVEVDGVPHLILVAKRDIHENEELTYDYGDRREKAIFFHPWLAH